ncbi:aspartic peptidase A1 [Mycena olivaceomarginata]|nr:aspartic peptidase A1 [Mycena olivaceomarginata]
MHSLIPLSLFLTVLDVARAVGLPFYVRTSSTPPPNRLGRRAVPISNNGNAAYIANLTLAGTSVSVILDTGSSDLWVHFPGTPPTTTDTGKGLSLSYAVGSASGNIHTAQLVFDNFTVENQAFLQVNDASSFSSDSAFDGARNSVRKLGGDAGDTMLNRIFQQNKTTANYITFLLDRKNDPGEPFTGQFTIGEAVKGFENITSQTKLNVETVHKLLEDQQHWQALTDKDKTVIGPDGNVINIDSIVPKAPDGQMVAVFDSGFTFSQVPRDMSDAIYGRVQGAVYDSKNEWWTVPCGQMINLTFSFGGKAFPIHPLDVNGNHPITSAFSLFGNFDMIMGMTFLRNAYTLMNFGDWVEDTSSRSPTPAAHADFVNVRLGGVDTTGSAQYALLPADQQQHSPVSAEEKKKKYEEMILSRWPYILGSSLSKQARNKGYFEQKSQTYLPLQVQGGGAPPQQHQHQQQGYGYSS